MVHLRNHKILCLLCIITIGMGGCININTNQLANNTEEMTFTGDEDDGTLKMEESGDTSSDTDITTESDTATSEEENTEEETTEVSVSRVSVHDPSVVYDQGMYYIFGSHMAWAKSSDLRNWETFTMNINSDYDDLFGKEWEEYCYTEDNPNLNGNLWAPDVIYNESMQKYCMYMSVNGSDYNSVIVLLQADSIEGPYEYVGPVVYSGFNTTTHPAELTDVYQVLGDGADLTRYQSTSNTKLNAIDPCVKYDDNGDLWMSFGSWFGGIYLMKLDSETGLRDYTYTYETVPNESDQYYGIKIAGGFSVSGEGSYILQVGEYYYLFLSYGGLTAEGGYQIRVFRSKEITGPYLDEDGNSAVYSKNVNNLFEKIGIRLMGSYDWTGNREIRVAQGHNSAVIDENGNILLVYHSRFADGKNGIAEAHEVRVQQMFVNSDGWLVCAPYEYCGEEIDSDGYSMEEMAGTYEFVLNTPTTYYQKAGSLTIGIEEASSIQLNEDGTVTGEYSGTWTYEEGSPAMTITIDGITYSGVFLKMPSEQLFFDPDERKIVMTFSVLGDNVTAWGSK